MPIRDLDKRRESNRLYHKNRRKSLQGTELLRQEDRVKRALRMAKLRAWIAQYKTDHGCTDCGYNVHPAALDFDHVGTHKTKNVSKLRTLKKVKKEIEQCELRCANCHRIVTYERSRT
jgi:hypothetical protein